MSMRMNRDAYERVIAEDLAWLMKQPRTLERDHVAEILRRSADHEYREAHAPAVDALSAPDEPRDRLIRACGEWEAFNPRWKTGIPVGDMVHGLEIARKLGYWARKVLSIDDAPPITSAACPNATATCSPTCDAWTGEACNCKAAPPAVDLATVEWTAEERATLLEFTKVRRLCNRKGACGPCASWMRVSFSVSDDNPSVLTKSIRDLARALLAVRKVAT